MRDGTPNGYNILHFDGNQYKYDYKVAGENAAVKMRVYGPQKVLSGKYNGGEFFVNFFQGSEKDSVFYSVDGENWKIMRYVVEPDPYICGLRYEWDHAVKMPGKDRPSGPDLCHHLWKARVSTKLPIGKNTYQIKIKDISGRVFETSYSFDVVNPD